jgi:hypothetical protein
MSFVSALDAEIAELEKDIKANPDPRVRKLEDLKRIRSAYYATNTSRVAVADRYFTMEGPPLDRRADKVTTDHFDTTYSQGSFVIRPRPPGRKRSPEREEALRQAELFLEGKTEPVKTAEIYEMLQFKGIEVSGEDPKSNLSAMLSNADQFQSHGRAGWTLARVNAGATPD